MSDSKNSKNNNEPSKEFDLLDDVTEDPELLNHSEEITGYLLIFPAVLIISLFGIFPVFFGSVTALVYSNNLDFIVLPKYILPENYQKSGMLKAKILIVEEMHTFGFDSHNNLDFYIFLHNTNNRKSIKNRCFFNDSIRRQPASRPAASGGTRNSAPAHYLLNENPSLSLSGI